MHSGTGGHSRAPKLQASDALKTAAKRKNERAVAGVMGQAGAKAMGRYFEGRSELRLTT